MDEKIKLFKDVYDGIIPERVPINVSVGFEACVVYMGEDLKRFQWDMEYFEPVMDKFCNVLYSDVSPVMPSVRLPGIYHFLQAQSFIPAQNGYIQHPEVVGMMDDEYDDLIENPYDCIIEKVLPRQFKSFSDKNPFMVAMSLYKAITSDAQDMALFMSTIGKMNQKYGYFASPANSSRSTEAPFDYLADQLRSFSGISKDIKRHRDKLVPASDALYEFAFKKGLPGNISPYGQTFFPLHMPPFMREKDFAELWWPSFKKLIEHLAALGVHSRIFCEQDWTRYTDYLQELPADTIMWFEYGDPKYIKDKLGNKFILTGFYPLTSLKNKSKQECLDLAKNHIDILAPGGKYIFGFDKIPVNAGDINMENLCALTEFIKNYGRYDNAGKENAVKFSSEGYSIPDYRHIESKYFRSFDDYKSSYSNLPDCAQRKYDLLNNSLYQFLLGLIY